MIPDEVASFYEKNEDLSNFVLSLFFRVDREELEDLSAEEIAVYYGEDFVVKRYKKAAEGYGNFVSLSGKEATYENFKDTLKKLEGGVDILLNLHGTESTVLFYGDSPQYVRAGYTGRSVEKDRIAEDINKENIGFVYQTLCYGSKNMDTWLNTGAEVVNGAKGENSFVVFSPEVFLEEWTKPGKNFEEAIEKSYNYERRRFEAINLFLSESLFDSEESKMKIQGDKSYQGL